MFVNEKTKITTKKTTKMMHIEQNTTIFWERKKIFNLRCSTSTHQILLMLLSLVETLNSHP